MVWSYGIILGRECNMGLIIIFKYISMSNLVPDNSNKGAFTNVALREDGQLVKIIYDKYLKVISTEELEELNCKK